MRILSVEGEELIYKFFPTLITTLLRGNGLYRGKMWLVNTYVLELDLFQLLGLLVRGGGIVIVVRGGRGEGTGDCEWDVLRAVGGQRTLSRR